MVTVGLAGLVALAWAYLAAGAAIDMSMVGMPMERMPWPTSYAALMFTMWWMMMIAMMVPSASAMVLLFTAIKRRQAASANPSAEALGFFVWLLMMLVRLSLGVAFVQ